MNFIPQVVFFLLMVGFLAISAFFSCSETALFSLTPEMLRQSSKKGRVHRILLILREHPAELLSCILFGNLIVNVLFFCTGAVAASRWGEARGDWFEALGGMLILVAVILFGEIVPKAMGVNYSYRIIKLIAGPLQVWFRLTRYPLRPLHLLEGRVPAQTGLTPEELKELLDTVRHEPGFGLHEKAVLEDIVNLSDIRVREVLAPRFELLRKSMFASREEVLNEARVKGSRYVILYGDKEDDLIGYIKIHELFFNNHSDELPHDLICPLVFIPETKRVDVLLREFMKEDWELAAVVDEYGGLSGVVSLEDLFSEVIGELDEEEAENIVKIDEVTYRLDGQLSVRVWRELFAGVLHGQKLETVAFDTLGGLIISLLGRMPQPGDFVVLRNVRLTVESVSRRCVGTVLLELSSMEEAT